MMNWWMAASVSDFASRARRPSGMRARRVATAAKASDRTNAKNDDDESKATEEDSVLEQAIKLACQRSLRDESWVSVLSGFTTFLASLPTQPLDAYKLWFTPALKKLLEVFKRAEKAEAGFWTPVLRHMAGNVRVASQVRPEVG